MLNKQSIKIGKLIKKTMRLRGGGSALPGLVVEKLSPNFLKKTLSELPRGVVLISGTNGKTTTTKIVTELLKSHDLKVFTNKSGSNFTRGVVASLLDFVDKDGKIDMDIAVLELDEAHAVQFTNAINPKYSLILNVFRDQLDRFGEIDKTAKLLSDVVEKTTDGVVLNRDDSMVRSIGKKVKRSTKLQYFGVSEKLANLFPEDSDMRENSSESNANKKPVINHRDVIVSKLSDSSATFAFGEENQKPIKLKLSGIYNIQNAAAALSLVRMILQKDFDTQKAFSALKEVRPAFGRGEAVDIDSQPLEIVLVKNPSGFRLGLSSYAKKPASTMIAINDLYADGRDMSWLWDVDFSQFSKTGVPFVSGIRAYEMAMRLQYDEIKVGRIISDPAAALREFINSEKGPKRIYCTYTAMLAIRRELAKTHELEAIE